MPCELSANDRPAPSEASGAAGALRADALRAALGVRPATAPAVMRDSLAAWAQERLAELPGTPIGMDPTDVPDRWYDLLTWAGVPFALGGALRWGRDLTTKPRALCIEEQDGGMVLPMQELLTTMSSLALRPLRSFIGRRLGCRLQAATGIHLFLYADRALVVSALDVPVGGFLYGNAAGHRSTLALEPGAWQIVTW